MSFEAYLAAVKAKTGRTPEQLKGDATKAGVYARDMKAAQMVAWLARNGMLTSAKRTAISGTIAIDGKPLYWGSLTLAPLGFRYSTRVTLYASS